MPPEGVTAGADAPVAAADATGEDALIFDAMMQGVITTAAMIQNRFLNKQMAEMKKMMKGEE